MTHLDPMRKAAEAFVCLYEEIDGVVDELSSRDFRLTQEYYEQYKDAQEVTSRNALPCPMGCGWLISSLIPMDAGNLWERADSFTTQYSLMVEHLQEEHDGRIGGR